MNNHMLTFLFLPLLAAAADAPNPNPSAALNGRFLRGADGTRLFVLGNGERHVIAPGARRGVSVIVQRGSFIHVNQAEGPQTPTTSYRDDVSDSNLSDDGLAPDKA